MQEKKKLRKALMEKRNQIPKDDKEEKERRLVQALSKSPLVKEAQEVLFYMAFGSEPDLYPLAKELLDQGKTLYLPRVDKENKCIIPIPARQLDRLEKSAYGIWEPALADYQEKALKKIDLAIISGIAYDQAGYRLGYGAAYYDYLLPRLDKAVRVGVCFKEVFLDRLPRQAHDQPMDYVLVENIWHIP